MLTGVLYHRAAEQPLKVVVGEASSAQIKCIVSPAVPVDFSGGRVVMATPAGDVVATQLGSGRARFDFGASMFSSVGAGVGEYDVVFIDDAGTYGPAGAYHQVIPPSPLLLSS